jgi:hypothetical protein
MKRYVLVLIALMLLTVPLMAGANDQGWVPPDWTATPPARRTVDPAQLVQLLVAKGVISDQEYARLTQPQLSSPTESGQARAWTWDEVYHNPVRSRP